MQHEENEVIRYLMKEMDPSEELLMERAMMEDDDLLIEVESMRKMLRRLEDMPDKEPPADLSKAIVQQAADHKKQSRWPSVPSGFFKYAAVLIIGAGLGSGLWMLLDTSPEAPADKYENPAAIISTLQPEGAENTNADTEPWVDRDDVIYFQDMFNQGSTGYNAILEASMEKLTPVTNQSFQVNPNVRNVQLTGSNN